MEDKFMKTIGVIPARYNSSRFPGKPLADICGKPMMLMLLLLQYWERNGSFLQLFFFFSTGRIACPRY